MRHLSKIGIALFVFALTLSSCQKLELEKEVPDCVEQEIKKIKKEDVRNPPASVWEWPVDGRTYYYITSDCCDQLNFLYDDNCNTICAPDGGISGTGDGKCPTFTGTVEWTLIWKDDR